MSNYLLKSSNRYNNTKVSKLIITLINNNLLYKALFILKVLLRTINLYYLINHNSLLLITCIKPYTLLVRIVR